jgi:hypothetical protein
LKGISSFGKKKRSGIKIFKFWARSGYTCDGVRGKTKGNVASTDITLSHGMVQKVKGVGHKIFMDNYFTTQKFSLIYAAGK